MTSTEMNPQLPDELRDVAWTRAGARMASGDKEFVRLSPSDIFVPDGMTPRSAEVREAVQNSMKQVGQIVPIIITKDGHELLDGATRLAAAKTLDLPFVLCVTVADLDEWERIAVRLLVNVDSYRRSFTVLEAVIHYNRIAALLAAKATRNKSLNGGDKTDRGPEGAGVPNFGTPVPIDAVGDSAKAAAEMVPYSHETIRKVNLVRSWADSDELPASVREIARGALEQIARTNKVNAAYRQAQEAVARGATTAGQGAGAGEVSAQAWCDMELAISKAETLLRVDVAGVVAFGLQANDDHKVFLPRLAALREWIAAYERACQK